MPSFKRQTLFVLAILLNGNAFAGNGYVIGLGAEGDTSDSRAYSAFGDFGLTEKTWLSATVARAQAEGTFTKLQTLYGELGVDHFFGPVGVRIAAAYWGDDDILDSIDVRGSLYLRSDAMTLTADYERRNFDFLFNLEPLLERRQVEFEADGYGLNLRANAGQRVDIFIRGMRYDYSVDLTRLQNISDLNFLASSRLSLANSLLDHRLDAGIEVNFGLNLLSFEVGRRQTAIDSGRVDSYSIGFLFPASDASDIEVRVGHDDSDEFGGSTVLSLFWFFYGT